MVFVGSGRMKGFALRDHLRKVGFVLGKEDREKQKEKKKWFKKNFPKIIILDNSIGIFFWGSIERKMEVCNRIALR